ncbi:MAG: substrate-binding domain-containing protein [Rectinemataceae bacterium]
MKYNFIAVTHDILGDVFWEVFRKGLNDAAERYNVNVEHLRPGKFSPEKMVELIEEAKGKKPDGILATIPDINVVERPLQEILDANIPMFAINAGDPRPDEKKLRYLSYIGPDDILGGKVAARRLLKEKTCQRVICIDHYELANYCHNARWQGILSVLGKANVSAERLRVPGGNRQRACEVLKEHLEKLPKIDGLISLGPPGAEISDAVIMENGYENKIAHMTFDFSMSQLKAIEEGRIIATIDSQQYLQGYWGVEFLWLYVEKGFVPAGDVLTGPVLVERSSVARILEGVKQGIH